ncbi:MAG: cobalamin-binding protein [Elusimicrobia bacterium]|nr:cobalamin-binding protein [Elusimicrobiota bacterium]
MAHVWDSIRFLRRFLWGGLLWVVFCPAAAFCSGSSGYISLAPSTTEILFALGLEARISGVSSYCNYPPRAAEKTRVGDFSHPNLEVILALNPEYIFCTGLEQAPTVARLKALGFRVYCADPSGVEELLKTIREIGAITKKDKRALEIIAEIRAGIAETSEKTKLIPEDKRVKVFLEIWHDPLMTAGKGSFVDELIEIAGGINIAREVRRPYCNFSAEQVAAMDPDCIILAYMDERNAVGMMGTRFGWENIKAVRSGKVFNDLNPDLILRPGPRVAEGVRELQKRMYPSAEGGVK